MPTDPSLVIVLDTGAQSQLGAAADYVRSHLDRVLLIDHHLSGDVLAPNRVIDTTAAATAELVTELLDQLSLLKPSAEHGDGDGSALLSVIGPALYLGIASDTGWFRFSNTTPRTLRTAARLLETGVDHASIYALTEQGDRPEKLLLLRRALDSLELLAGERAAVMTLRLRDFAETGATEAETERIIDLPQQVRSIEVVALVTERTPPAGGPALTSVSFRSKPLPDAVNVADLAGRFGGGGHARAAGAKVQSPVEEVLPRVRDALIRAMQA